MEANMRLAMTGLAALIAFAALTTVDVPSSDAQVSTPRNPWCLRDGPLGHGTWDCTYQTLAQCRMSSNNDSDGFCTQNPNYRGKRR
jgi:hypothetical protein